MTTRGGGGELHVDMSGEHGWFPNVLPSKDGGGDWVSEETMFPVLF